MDTSRPCKFRQLKVKFLLSACALLCVAMHGLAAPLLDTWVSLGQKAPEIPFPSRETLPPQNAEPWAGTVSHHLLAGKLIDDWFRELHERFSHPIQTFFIISPSHYGFSTQPWSLADCSWRVSGGVVHTDAAKEKALAASLAVPYDTQVFPVEHGVNTLIPFIAKYFPSAKVCAVAVHGEPPLNQHDAQRLAHALAPYFTDEGRKENFLLISTDFSHHGNVAETARKDERSRIFFRSPTKENVIFCGCDNRPGMYVLSQFLQPSSACAVLYHTNSYELSGGKDGEDITSYFFSFFYFSSRYVNPAK